MNDDFNLNIDSKARRDTKRQRKDHRPLNIYCYEDKLVQDALRRILEAVFEPMFCDEMLGLRPGRGRSLWQVIDGSIVYAVPVMEHAGNVQESILKR